MEKKSTFTLLWELLNSFGPDFEAFGCFTVSSSIKNDQLISDTC